MATQGPAPAAGRMYEGKNKKVKGFPLLSGRITLPEKTTKFNEKKNRCPTFAKVSLVGGALAWGF